jgi:hypothetical protein
VLGFLDGYLATYLIGLLLTPPGGQAGYDVPDVPTAYHDQRGRNQAMPP